MRNEEPALRFRIPHSAFRIGVAVGLWGCNPATTRPVFLPYPEAPFTVLDATRERIVPEITAWLQAEGFRVVQSEPRDGYVETAWYDPVTRRSFRTERDVPHLERTFRIRCWMDADILRATRLTVEAVYRPVYDPSRTSRDLEVLVPEGQAGREVALRLIEEMKKKLGVPPGRN